MLTPLQACVLQIMKCLKTAKMLSERTKTYREVYEKLAGVKVNGRDVRDLMIRFTPPSGELSTITDTMDDDDFNFVGPGYNPFADPDWQRDYEPATKEAVALVREFTTVFNMTRSEKSDLEKREMLNEIKDKFVELGEVFQSAKAEPTYELQYKFENGFLVHFKKFADFLENPPYNPPLGNNQDKFDLWTAIQPLAIACSGDFPCKLLSEDESPKPKRSAFVQHIL